MRVCRAENLTDLERGDRLTRILVLDGHSAAALAVTRSAGRAGYWVAVGANRGIFAAAKLSRYCRLSFDYPISTTEPEAFVAAVLGFVRANKIDLIVPVTDWTLGPISAHRLRFSGISKLAIPSQSALEFSSDKFRTIELAQSIGIEVPKTVIVADPNQLSRHLWSSFPVVVKDRYSVRWLNGKAVFGSVAYAYSEQELHTRVMERTKAAGDVLIQEFVGGVGIGLSCFVIGGSPFLPFQWKRIREVDPRGSGSSARKSIALDPVLFSHSVELITKMGFEGIAMVECKQTPDGRLILMEVNGRPWGSIGLPIASGIDYPLHLINWYVQGVQPPSHIRYRENVLCRRLVGELTHLSNIRLGRPQNWPGNYPRFWPTVFDMALPWRPGMCYDDLWISDPRPGLAGIGNFFRSRLMRR
jgi:predicted ATP-grasp superfamily ATP-dependent carboligase